MASNLTPDPRLQQAEQAIRSGQMGPATLLLQALVKEKPQLSKARELLGTVFLRTGDMARASEQLQAAAALPDASALAHYLLGSVCLSQGQHEEAATHLARSVQVGPPFFEALHNLGTALMHLGHREDALRAFEQALALKEHPEAWQSRGLVLQHLGRQTEAITSFQKVIALQPEHPQAWASLGSSYQVSGQHDKARDTFLHALTVATSTEDQERIRYSLACLQGQDAPTQAPQAYVQHLFDQCADQFDEILVEQLGYRGPERLFDAVCQVRDDQGWKILDLGCGTGLCGKVFKGKASLLDGVDLSAGMLEKARQLGVYDSLAKQDIQQHLEQSTQTYDCVIVADVFVYIGQLDNIFAGMAARLAPNGVACFSIESLEDQGTDFLLRATGRYAQSVAYIERLAKHHGFEIKVTFSQPVRMEKGLPVDGQFFVLMKSR